MKTAVNSITWINGEEYFVCEECGEYHRLNVRNVIEIEGEPMSICTYCLNDFIHCTVCGEYHRNDGRNYFLEDGETCVCNKCETDDAVIAWTEAVTAYELAYSEFCALVKEKGVHASETLDAEEHAQELYYIMLDHQEKIALKDNKINREEVLMSVWSDKAFFKN